MTKRVLVAMATAWGIGLALGPPLATAVEGLAIEQGKIRAITEEVMASQRDPRGRQEKLDALRAYERFLMDDARARSTLKAEALHRLGDLYSEIETSTYEKRLREARASPKTGERNPPTPMLDRTKSIGIYERLLGLYPARPENDSAFYQLARAYSETGRETAAIARLQELLSRYPRSMYVPEAAFRIGKQAGAARDFTRAANLFQTTVSAWRNHAPGVDAPLAEAAAFQLGWIHLNLAEYRQAADAFILTLDSSMRLARPDSSEGPMRRFSLANFSDVDAAFVRETINAALIAFDYLGGPREMRAYFDAAGHRPYEEQLYRTMGTLYQTQDRTPEVVEAYEAFLAVTPHHPDAPLFQAAIAEVYTKAKSQDALIEARARLVERYGPKSAWAQANAEGARAAARPLVKEALYQLALYHHARAQDADRPEAYRRALAWDDQFLASFPADVEASRIAWLRAEALFELGQYAEAAEAYTHSAYDSPPHAQSREAAYAAIVAWERTLPPPDVSGTVPSPLAVEGLATRVDRFLAAFPDDPRGADLLMKTAETAARTGRTDRALGAAERVVGSYPTSRWTGRAYQLIGQIHYDRRAYAQAEDAFRHALGASPGATTDALAGLASAALYQEAAAQQRAGNEADAARRYARVADDFPTSTLAPVALADAATLHADRGEIDAAKREWNRVVSRYPDSAQATEALRRLAQTAENEQAIPDAIHWYEILAARSAPPAQAELTWRIARLAQQATLWPRAERAFTDLTNRSDLPPAQAMEAGFLAAETAARQGRTEHARQRADAVLERYRVWRASRKREETALTPVDVLAASALLDLADRKAEAFRVIRLTEPLDRRLVEKRAALTVALDGYTEAAEIKVAGVTTAAIYNIGGLLESFSRALLTADSPADLTPDQREQYRLLLEEQAAPYEERAVSAYETNARRARNLDLYDQWVQRSFERLAALRPMRYDRRERVELVQRTLEPR